MNKPDHIERLYIDFDAFFANVEKQLDPAIRNLPVGVTSLPSEQATLITCCYMAKANGVKRGMKVYAARELCPNLVIRSARHDIYVDMHKAILKEVNRHVPIRKVWSIDEVECALIGREQQAPLKLAYQIKQSLASSIGPYVTPSIGLAPNQFLAKIAAEMNKPNGLTILHPDDLPGPLFTLKLHKLPGIAKGGMLDRLNKAHIHTVEDLWNISAKHARKIWGNIEGERLWAQLRGYSIVRPDTQRRMFGHSRILSGEWSRPDKALECLRLLTSKAAYRMRREGFTARAMAIKVKSRQGQSYRRETSFPTCNDDFRLSQHMRRLFGSIEQTASPQLRVKNVYVMLHDIAPIGSRSGDLFNEAPDNPKWIAATQIMDKLNEKHGTRLLHLGPKVDVPGGYAGAKIAFGRVPDAQDFF